MSERDYVLGTNDAEVARLGLQHRVWRPYALDAWRRAGITEGDRVIDFGAGPGFAALDLAEIVGAAGEVVALERSERFLGAMRAQATARGLDHLKTIECDLAKDAPPALNADAAWARWIFAFLPHPEEALKRLASAVRPGGVIVLHEYLDYCTWRLSPRSAPFERFVAEVMASWRDTGGEPNVGLDLPRWMEEAGLVIEQQRAIVEVVRPRDFMWRWPASFTRINLDRLVELGRFSRAEAEEIAADFARIEKMPAARMVTPVVMELIGRKL
ncbi:MAG: methyltransferase domain-containing protein [Alphaproteobacteria bacterium]|nr:methyltransferase domain-containing protein [Alphaproteobacteria bacterium]